jgi:hypothetical protein
VALQPGADPHPSARPAGLGTADAATVRRHVAAAIDAADGILHETTRDAFVKRDGAIVSEAWTDLRDPNASRTREDRRGWDEPATGFAVSDIGRVPSADGTLLQRAVTDGRCTETLFTGVGPAGSTNPLSSIRREVEAHRFTVVGLEQTGGRRLLHLRRTATDRDFPRIEDRYDLWVDPATYVPVRSDSTYGDPSAAAGDPNEVQRITSDYELLPRPADPRSLLLPAGTGCTRTTHRAVAKGR